MNSSKILITGAAGFIGYHLAKDLISQGEKLVLIDDFSRGKLDQDFSLLTKTDNITFINADLTKRSAFNQIEDKISCVYHLAAINGTDNFYNIPDKVLRVNILSTLNLLEWAKSKSNVKIIFSSSSEVYAGSLKNGIGSIPTKEDIPLCIDDISNVRWSYGASKLLSENAFFSYNKNYEIKFSIIRFHNIYGPRMGYKHVMPQFMERILVKNQNPLKVYGGRQTRAFCYISDAVSALKIIMESNKTNQAIINIGNDEEEIKINDLAKLVIKLSGSNNTIVEKDAPVGSVVRRCPDISLLKSLGYNPLVSLEEGLSIMMGWYKDIFSNSIKYES